MSFEVTKDSKYTNATAFEFALELTKVYIANEIDNLCAEKVISFFDKVYNSFFKPTKS